MINGIKKIVKRNMPFLFTHYARLRDNYYHSISKLIDQEVKAIKRCITTKDKNNIIFIDCGCNDGTVLGKFVSYFPNAEFIGFEVQTELVVRARRKFGGNRRVSIYENGVSDRTRVSQLYLPKSYGVNFRGGASIIPKKVSADNLFQLRKILLIDLVEFLTSIREENAESFIVIKMDIEGAEYAIIKALHEKFLKSNSRLLDYLIIEWHDEILQSGEVRKDFYDMLKEMAVIRSNWV